MNTVAIIGGGFSGTITAVQLSRIATEPIRINLINAKNPFGKGVAYSTPYDFHLLNVKAGRMSAFPDEPDNFVIWLKNTKEYSAIDIDRLKQQFISRKIYGCYISEILDTEINDRNNIQLIQDEVIDVEHTSDSFTNNIFLRSGQVLKADKIVLALGNFLPAHPFHNNEDFVRSRFYVNNPWFIQFSELTSTTLPVLLIGSGLTMADVFLNLQKIDYRGKIYVLSRNGFLPAPHSNGEDFTFDEEISNYSSLRELYKLLKRNLKRAYENGNNLEGALKVIRKNIQHLWQQLTLDDKKQFLRHVSSKWNIVRHRVPETIHKKLAESIRKGQIEVIAGRLEGAEISENIAVINYKNSKGESKSIKAIKVINCTGPLVDYSKIDSSLIKNLLHRQYIQPHQLKLGIEATADGTVLQPDGKPSKFLHVLGNALTGLLWESVAVPELRMQAKTIAQTIIQLTVDHKNRSKITSKYN